MIWKYILCISIIYLCIAQTYAAGLKNNAISVVSNINACYLEHYGKALSEDQWNIGVATKSSILDDRPSFTKLYSAKSRNIRSIDTIEVNGNLLASGNKYVDVILVRQSNNKDLELTVVLGSDFKDYEKYETSTVMKIEIKFSCENGDSKSLILGQQITDTNNHDPKFIYDRILQFEVAQNHPAYKPIGQITVEDIDLTNSMVNITFASSGNKAYEDYVLVDDLPDPNDPKTLYASLLSRKTLSLTDSVQMKINVQDSGIPKRNASTTLYLDPATTGGNGGGGSSGNGGGGSSGNEGGGSSGNEGGI